MTFEIDKMLEALENIISREVQLEVMVVATLIVVIMACHHVLQQLMSQFILFVGSVVFQDAARFAEWLKNIFLIISYICLCRCDVIDRFFLSNFLGE